MSPLAIGKMPEIKKRVSHMSRLKSSYSKVSERASEKNVMKNPKTTHKDSALLIPLPL